MLGVKKRKTAYKYTIRSMITGYQPFCCATEDKFVYPCNWRKVYLFPFSQILRLFQVERETLMMRYFMGRFHIVFF